MFGSCHFGLRNLEWMGKQIRKQHIFNFFFFCVWRQLKKNWFRSGDMNVTWNLAAPEANLCGSSTNIAVLKNFATFTEKDLCTSLFLKHATLLEKRPWHKCFPFNSKKKHLFCRTPWEDCFCYLENYLGSIYTKLATWMLVQWLENSQKKCILVKFQTCISNWILLVVFSNNFIHLIFRAFFHGRFWFISFLRLLFLFC